MARKVIWTLEASDDLAALAEYIAKDSLAYAAAFIRRVIDSSRSLDEFSARGRVVPELCDPDVRELLVRGYRLIYRVEPAYVVILTIVHGARDLKTLLEKESSG